MVKKKKKKTIGASNPLTEYLHPTQRSTNKAHKGSSAQHKTTGARKSSADDDAACKQRVTIHIDAELIDRVKNAVFWEPGLTLTEFTHDAFVRQLKKMEKEWGEPYPERTQKHLKGGRPLS